MRTDGGGDLRGAEDVEHSGIVLADILYDIPKLASAVREGCPDLTGERISDGPCDHRSRLHRIPPLLCKRCAKTGDLGGEFARALPVEVVCDEGRVRTVEHDASVPSVPAAAVGLVGNPTVGFSTLSQPFLQPRN